jgi:4-hydroxybenzoate polyprenyltransferase
VARRAALELARSSHPEAVVAVTALTTLLALVAGRGAGSLLVLSATLTGQLFVGWSNDLLDSDLDRRQGRSDKPVAAGRIEPPQVRAAAAAALALCIPLSFANGAAAGLVHLAAVAGATAYNLGLKFGPASPLPFAISFGLLPSFVTLGLPGQQLAPAWATAAAALLGVGGHLTQTLPDIARDRAQGRKGIPHRLGPTLSAITAAGSMLAAAVLVALGPARRRNRSRQLCGRRGQPQRLSRSLPRSAFPPPPACGRVLPDFAGERG